MQGIALGALVQGIRIADRQYAGGWWDWLTPFSVLCGVAVVVGYGLLGACWLNLKTIGDAADKRAQRLAIFAGGRHAGADRRGQPLDAVPQPDLLQPLVRVAGRRLLGGRAGAAGGLRLRRCGEG